MRREPMLSLAAAAALFTAPGLAQAQRGADVMDFNHLEVTCGEFMQAVRAADAGPNPTAQRKAQADAALDSIADGVIWLHGYESATLGLNAAPPLNRAYFTDRVTKMVAACAAKSRDGRMRLVDAARTQ
jgi:hypothetical protein